MSKAERKIRSRPPFNSSASFRSGVEANESEAARFALETAFNGARIDLAALELSERFCETESERFVLS